MVEFIAGFPTYFACLFFGWVARSFYESLREQRRETERIRRAIERFDKSTQNED